MMSVICASRAAALIAGALLLHGCATAEPPVAGAGAPVSARQAEAPPAYDAAIASAQTAPAEIDCIAQMSALAGGDPEGRHQLFLLVQEIGRGATPDMVDVLSTYGLGSVDPETPVMDVIETIANPVLLQAAPGATVGQMGHLIRFSQSCAVPLDGQIAALEALMPSLGAPAYRQPIQEDALFIRSILLDALYRLEADRDSRHGQTIADYQRDLVSQRDEMEFAAFEAEIAQLEADFAGDLESRLGLAAEAVGENAQSVDARGAAEVARALSEVQRAEANARMAEIIRGVLGSY